MKTPLPTTPLFGVIASVTDTTIQHTARAISGAREADSIEFRLDYMRPHFAEFLPWLAHRISHDEMLHGKKIILTLRSSENGGTDYMSPHDQLVFWKSLPAELHGHIADENSRIYVDWGLDIAVRAQHKGPAGSPFPWSKIGCSLHEFKETPDNLSDLLTMLEESKAEAFLKLVTLIRDYQDPARLKALFDGRTDPRPLIAFGMGERGQDSRRKCLIWGSAGTYGYIQGHTKAAPGQLTIDELLSDPSVQAAMCSHSS